MKVTGGVEFEEGSGIADLDFQLSEDVRFSLSTESAAYDDAGNMISFVRRYVDNQAGVFVELIDDLRKGFMVQISKAGHGLIMPANRNMANPDIFWNVYSGFGFASQEPFSVN